MNTKSLCIGLLLSVATLGGCSLQEEPYGFASTDNFYQSEQDAQAAIVYAYSILPEIEYYSRVFFIVTELPTENLTIKPDAGASNFELDELRTRADNPEVTTAWRYAYIGINRANAVIANVPDIDNMDEALRNQIVGEAYFLRALHYFNLVRLFGEAPMRTEPVTSIEQVNAPKSSLQELYDLIVADLQQASQLMDQVRRDGRANQVGAWALLSKVYLHMASSKSSGSPGYDFVPDADAAYAEAKNYAGKVLNDQSQYGLDDQLRDIFDIDQKGGPEHIFSVATDRTGQSEGNYSKLPLMFIPYIDGAVMTLDDGVQIKSGWNHFLTEPGLYNSYADHDKRKTELIVSTVTVNGEERTLGINDYSRPFTRKFIDPYQVGDQTSVNTPVLRYSDLVLVYAEASGPTTEGYDAINQVRARAGLDPLAPGMDAATFRAAVVQERAWELAFEGNRLFDLRRTHQMESVLEGQFGKQIQNAPYFFDIPQNESDLNPEL
ncbi:Starch-binding associating with outer membrane [Catalinimonas alkaloidigena]|uniref:Starch-binding associating with outer membrane n=1 Tax=Catalinimonas alkaloidigena TaxID=1075417 RepID=A0A1G8XHM2_9BACT|nr:RagB/SusD family nutrient uptake outer membrane protein [Catalinimonas alkaloidigena]SDJ89936.1 Starch-binding associating with outer membrane [Catalinimonas alkaloidigena]